jgi:hypothetical protein
MSIETLKGSEEKRATIFNRLYGFCKDRKITHFQDIDKSNALIKKAGITYQDITLTG